MFENIQFEDLQRIVSEDNVETLTNILNSNDNLRNNFNRLHTTNPVIFHIQSLGRMPLLHLAVFFKSQRMIEYLLSQDFVDKRVAGSNGGNVYHIICAKRGEEELFSIIEQKFPHHLLLNNLHNGRNAFHIACQSNNVFIVKRVYEILESLKLNLTSITKSAIKYAIRNRDIDVLKYVLSSIHGIQLNDDVLLEAIKYIQFDIVVHLLNFYIRQSIPSHLHNQFHIFQFADNNNNNNNNYNNNEKELIEENFKKLITIKGKKGNRIWRDICYNSNLAAIQLIYSLKGIRQEILNNINNNLDTLNDDYRRMEFNPFLIVCEHNSIKVIKFIHKLFPSFIHSHQKSVWKKKNAAYNVLNNYHLTPPSQLKILHYFYLHGIDIHFISEARNSDKIRYTSIYTEYCWDSYPKVVQYLKVISQDFDYQNNPHDDEAYRKPSFWKEFHNNNNNNNNNNNIADEQSMRINEWKNRFDEHVLHHLSKMIQQHMLKPNESYH